MDFIEHAQIMIPELTGLTMTVWDSDDSTFRQFERENCLSPQLQPIYTAAGLRQFFGKKDENHIYDILDMLDTRMLLMKIHEQWIALGPYVVTPWNENTARVLLAKVGAYEEMRLPYKVYRCKLPLVQHELAVHIAVLLVTHTPLVLAGYARYIRGIDDTGKAFEPSPDPLLDELCAIVAPLEVKEGKQDFSCLKALFGRMCSEWICTQQAWVSASKA